MCQQKYKCSIKDIKQWIKKTLNTKLAHSEDKEIADVNHYSK